MNASKAKRRWLAWCRYVAATNTQASPTRIWGLDVHNGQVRAYRDYMFAGRSWPRGARITYYPKWAHGGHR